MQKKTSVGVRVANDVTVNILSGVLSLPGFFFFFFCSSGLNNRLFVCRGSSADIIHTAAGKADYISRTETKGSLDKKQREADTSLI